MTEQASRITATCGTCAAECDGWLVQLIRDRRLHWERESSCASCGTTVCDGDRGAAPADVRAALLADHGEYRLTVEGTGPRSGAVPKAFRDAFEVSLAEAGSAANAARGAGWCGTRVEVALVQRLLDGAGVAASVIEVREPQRRTR